MFRSFWTKLLLVCLALAVAFVTTLSVFASNASLPEANSAFVWKLTATSPKTRIDESTITLLKQSNLQVVTSGVEELQRVYLSGANGLDQLRTVLHKGSAERLNPILAPTRLTLRGVVQQGERWTLALDSNLTTGYSWELVSAGEFVTEDSPYQLESLSNQIGAPLRQTFSFTAIKSGSASIELEYRRPFGPLETPTLVMEVQAVALPLLSNLTNPDMVIELELPPLVDQPALPSPAVGLPSYFSWKDLGKVTPIRNQANCGSCWAFATVASLETAVYIQDNEYSDLSEQYLVSCNTDGWDCLGGGTAHSYHQDKVPPGEPSTGAVMEEDFRYSASDEACNPPHSHAFKISSWHYVTTSTSDTNAIKNAIYNYGAVMAPICIGNAFRTYTGGVFNTNESYLCPYAGHANHAVNIIGWDDNVGAWIIKNSWGNVWGEEGYGRVAYGTSSIGTYASYVVYDGNPLPSRPNLISPAKGTNFGTTQAPVFTWTTANRATQYYLRVVNDSGYDSSSGWISATSYPWGTLPAGIYHWFVKARNSQNQEGGWSESWSFTVANPPPAPELFVPSNGQNFSPVHVAELSWTYMGSGVTYSVYLCGSPNGDPYSSDYWQEFSYKNILYKPDACGDGPITWKVKAKNAAGEGPFSETRTFTIGWTLPKTELLSPVNNSYLSTALPVQLQWKPVPGAKEYYVEVWEPFSYYPRIESGWVTGTSWSPGLLTDHDPYHYSWWVKSRESYEGEGNWSLSWDFEMRDPPPAPTLVSPASGMVIQAGTAVTLTWHANAAPAQYHVRLWTDAGYETITPNQAGTIWNTDILPGGKYNWQVFAYGNEVDSLPSETRSFRVFGTPLAPEIVYPLTDPVPHSRPARISWKEDINSAEYRIELWKTGEEGTILADSGWIDKLSWLSCALEPTDYSFRIKSRNPYGESEWSGIYQFTAYDDYPVMLPIIFR